MAAGDVMLGWEVGRQILREGPDVPWAGVGEYFDEADLVVANLECVISDLGEPWPTKLIHLRAPLEAAESLAAGGIDVVSVANNHALDYGRPAFLDMLDLLDAAAILHAGGGTDEQAAHAPAVVEVNGLRIAFLGYVLPFATNTSFHTREWEAGPNGAGIAVGTQDAVRADVRRARDASDAVVVMVHGGLEYRSRPTHEQEAFATAALDAGAVLVLGHHPHVLQGYRLEQGRLAAFSLGNFVFSRFDGAANDTAILEVTLMAGGVASMAWIPLVVEGGIPRPARGAEIDRVMAHVPRL